MAASRAIQVYNRQRTTPFDLAWLRRFARNALRECEAEGLAPGQPLAAVDEVEVSIVSDRAIAQVHRRFMQVSGPTDVITFEHGEIIISAATAARQGIEYAQTVEHELALYIIHGLLHLNGHDDLDEPAAGVMRRTQAALLERALRGAGSD